MMNRKSVRLFLSLAIVLGAAGVGSWVTFPAIGGWYAGLDKPFFSPPNWLFGPVWSVLYLMMAAAVYLVWTAETTRPKRLPLTLFWCQLVLNVAWSAVFFGLQQPWAAVGVIVALWLMIAATIAAFWPVKRIAAYLLMPYFAWVAFATGLNISVAMLNPPSLVSTYAECVKQPSSTMELSYPEVCVTQDGKLFTNPDASVDLPLQGTLSVPELSATIPLGEGIQDAYYRYDKSAGETYLTTAKLEEALKTLKPGCTSGLYGLYIVKEGGQLVEQERIETLCLPAANDQTKQINAIKDMLRTAIRNATIE